MAPDQHRPDPATGDPQAPPPPPAGYGYDAPGAWVPPPGAGPIPPGAGPIPPGAGPIPPAPVPPVGWAPTWTRPDTRRHLPVRPSPVFLGLVAAMAGSGAWLFSGSAAVTSTAGRIGIFVFVAVGWVVSLCLHEFAHAAVAWKSGDRSVEARGYLTLDPRRYMDRQLSIVLPVIFVLIGGIALPGGAVMIDRRLIPSRRRRSLVSAAGPLTNLACAVLCGIPLAAGVVSGTSHEAFADALAFLALLEVIATVLNGLPVPGLDGFGVIAPYLSDETVARLMPISRFVFLGLLVLLFSSAAASGAFFGVCARVLGVLGVDNNLASAGHDLFMFWRPLGS